MPSRLTGFVCPTVSMVTTGHATGVERLYYDVENDVEAPSVALHCNSLHQQEIWNTAIK